MVSGITGDFSVNTLTFIQSELRFAAIDVNGDITNEEVGGLSTDSSNAINLFGNNKNVITKKIAELIDYKTKQPKETSKEAAPDMNLDLDIDDIPSPPKV